LSALTFGWPTALELGDTVAARPLWVTTEAAGRYPANGIPVGPDQPFRPDLTRLARQTLAAAVTAPRADGRSNGGARLVVVGDANLLEDRFARGNLQNVIFATNALDWLAQDESLIRIRSKDRSPPPLLFRTNLRRDLLMWGNLAGVPLLVTLVGAIRIVRRRRRATRRWAPEG
jgi:ABC-type uncharacterized transport system involved in gliding motility auxiliary subunit